MLLSKRFLLGTTVIVGLALAAPTTLLAQPTTPPQQPATSQSSDEAQAQAQAAHNDEAEVGELVVTGSRIRKNEYTSASPIQVITSEETTLQGLVDTSRALQQSSIASGSIQINNQLTGFIVNDATPGVNTISLRGLGAQRTLVLLNGRRLGPAGVRGTVGPVDLNVIPNSLIDRVEILKDGASSIYGSDAVAGVVNIITKRNLDGGEANVYGNLSEHGGGNEYQGNIALGKTFSRGYFNIAGDYYEQQILRRRQRDDTFCNEDYLFSPDRQTRVDYTDANIPGEHFKCFNLLNNSFQVPGGGFGGVFQYPVAGVTYPTAAQGNTQPFAGLGLNVVRAARAGFPLTWPYANYGSVFADEASVISPVKRYTLSANGSYDLTPNVEVYGQFLFNRRESEQVGARQLFPTLSASNPNNLVGLTAVPIIALPISRSQDINYYSVLGGIKGKFGESFLSGWTWDLFAQYSHSSGDYTTDIVYNDRVVATTGAGVACNPNPAGGNRSNFNCQQLVPGGIPWLSPRVLSGQWTDQERAFLFTQDHGHTLYEQSYVEGSVSGDLFQLPAGPIGVALGFHLRHEHLDDVPGAQEIQNNLWGSTSAGRTTGSDTVKEVFAEAEAPILKGVPGFDSLTADGSVRYTHYDSYGGNTTYKVGLNWQVIPAIRFRGTYGTSFRAPALYELFLAHQTSFLGQTSVDPCINYDTQATATVAANCAAEGLPAGFAGGQGGSALIISGGGAGILKAETSKAFTVGVILTPSFSDLSVAVDYFDIHVENEVRRFGAANIVNQCYESPNFPTDPLCTLFVRNTDPASPNFRGIDVINDSFVNVADQRNRGIDLNFRYHREFSFGKITIDGQATWQTKDVTQLLGGSAPEDFNGSTTEPDFTGLVNARFDRGDWTVFWSTQFIQKTSDTELFEGDVFPFSRYSGQTGTGPGGSVYFKQYTEFQTYHSMSVRRVYDNWTFQVGVQNVFDERPPAQSNGQFKVGTAALNIYDMIGRRFFFHVGKKW